VVAAKKKTTRGDDTIKRLMAIISDTIIEKVSDQQSKYNQILRIFIPIFSFFIFLGDISDFFLSLYLTRGKICLM